MAVGPKRQSAEIRDQRLTVSKWYYFVPSGERLTQLATPNFSGRHSS